MKAENMESTDKIPEEMTCPFCNGQGYTEEGEDNEQCEECGGEGNIVVAEYAKEHDMTLKDAYHLLLAEISGEEEID